MPCEIEPSEPRSSRRFLGLHQAHTGTRNGNSLCKDAISGIRTYINDAARFVHKTFPCCTSPIVFISHCRKVTRATATETDNYFAGAAAGGVWPMNLFAQAMKCFMLVRSS